jgi:transcriptional regulator with XRE-family HTH domain
MPGSEAVGAKVRMIREQRNLSLDELSERSGIPRALIESIEGGGTLPSLAPLVKIARALGCRLGTFLDDHEALGPALARDAELGASIRFSGARAGSGALIFRPLAAGKAARHMEPFVIDVLPESAAEASESSHEGEEFVYVLSGSVEIAYGKERYELAEGDSIYYDSIVPHAVRSKGGARIVACVYAPFWGGHVH